MLNTSTAVLTFNKMPGKNIVVRKKKWDANDMAAAINYRIKDVEQMKSTLGRLLENM